MNWDTLDTDRTLAWLVLTCVVLLWLTLTYADQLDGDWTDTGVGCIEDCLEPADEREEVALWQI